MHESLSMIVKQPYKSFCDQQHDTATSDSNNSTDLRGHRQQYSPMQCDNMRSVKRRR